jgi:hypothetical protein
MTGHSKGGKVRTLSEPITGIPKASKKLYKVSNYRHHTIPELTGEMAERYLGSLMQKPVQVTKIVPLGRNEREDNMKFGGYGTPLRIDFRVADGEPKSLVLHTMRPGPFGHEHMSDRAQIMLWQHQAFSRLPRHVQALDVGGFRSGQNLASLGEVTEFFLLTEHAEGQGYYLDLERIRDTDKLKPLDLERSDALCDYLATIHRCPGNSPELYTRRIRELIGHSECIMGIVDSYPANSFVSSELLEEIERRCVSWRWRLKERTARLRQVHGDFHSWNILFRAQTDFSLLERSRGEYGDPADDVTCLTLNYVFFSLQRNQRLDGALETLFMRFWNRYLEKTGDREILQVVAPFFVFRALVMASPVWYPNLSEAVRSTLVRFVFRVLGEETFDPAQINNYCGA